MPAMPKVGDIVLYYESDKEAGPQGLGTNGTRYHPAMVTRVHANGRLNLQVFFDATGPHIRTAMHSLNLVDGPGLGGWDFFE